jgi:hypothetical protein
VVVYVDAARVVLRMDAGRCERSGACEETAAAKDDWIAAEASCRHDVPLRKSAGENSLQRRREY